MIDRLVHIVPTDYDRLFHSDPANHRVIPTAVEVTTSKTFIRDQIRELFQSESAGLTFVSSCKCAKDGLKGNYYTGIKCPKCGAVCETNFAKDLKYRGWLEIPDFAPPVFHPVATTVLTKYLGKKMMGALISPANSLPVEYKDVLGQGMSYVYENFDKIMHYLYRNPPKRYVSSTDTREIKEWLFKYRDVLFVRHLPVLNQSLHMLSSDGQSEYADKSSPHIISALVELSALSQTTRSKILGEYFMDQKLADMYAYYYEYAAMNLKLKLLRKPGLFRKDILGARLFNTFRGVLTPISGPHKFHNLIVPWAVMVVHMKYEILNFLVRVYKYSYPDAINKWAIAHRRFDKEIDEILQYLIDDCYWDDGIPVLFGRQPTMIHGSIQELFIKEYSRDVEDSTLHMSAAIMKKFNADCDGDTLYGIGMKEMAAVYDFFGCHPMCTMLGGDTPGISNAITLTKQASINIHMWLNDPAQFVEST